jgi:hypothetical protein
MNFLKKGPELKLSGIKVPDFLLDLYWDLHDRHLLPLAALLLVAIAVVPIALSQSSGPAPPSESAGEDAAISSSVTQNTGQLVVRSTPGLHDYKRRFRHLSATDPFKQRYTSNPTETSASATESGNTEVTESGSSTPAPEAPSSTKSAPEPPTGGEGTGGEGTPVPGKSNLTYYSFAIDVRVIPGSGQDREGGEEGEGSDENQVTVRRNLPELTMLPSRKTPAMIYMGSTKDGKKALMVVSSNVKAIFGDAKCVIGSETCQLLALEPGVPETVVYGNAGKTYKVELLKIHLVESEKLNEAPLGKPKKKHGKGN